MTSAVWSRHGRVLVTAGADKRVIRWNVEHGTPVSRHSTADIAARQRNTIGSQRSRSQREHFFARR